MQPNSPKLFQSMTISRGGLLVEAFGFLRSPYRFDPFILPILPIL